MPNGPCPGVLRWPRQRQAGHQQREENGLRAVLLYRSQQGRPLQVFRLSQSAR